MNYKQAFIEFMIDAGVLQFGDFITKSGRKTPFFINTGNYATGSQLVQLGRFYAEAVKEHFYNQIDVIYGPAYKGIPISVATVMAYYELYNDDLRYTSNRKEAKDHGEQGILLGSKLGNDDRVLILEDVITAGTSIKETIPLLAHHKVKAIQGLLVSVDRMEKGLGEKSALEEVGIEYNMKTRAIVTMKEVVEYLYNRPYHGKIIIDDRLKHRIDEYYLIYGV